MKVPKIVWISLLVGFISAALGDRLIGGIFGRVIGLACGLGIAAIVYLLILKAKEKSERKRKREGEKGN